MKLRQKLAAVLATAMVVTAVPVITTASTTNKIVKSVSVIKEDTKTAGVGLRMEFDQKADAGEEFYLDLENADWLEPKIFDTDAAGGVITYTYTDENGVTLYTGNAAGYASKVNTEITAKKAAVATAQAAYDATTTAALRLTAKATLDTAQAALDRVQDIYDDQHIEDYDIIKAMTVADGNITNRVVSQSNTGKAKIVLDYSIGNPAVTRTLEMSRQDDDTMKVELVTAFAKNDDPIIPMPIKATGGVVSVEVNGNGGSSTITKGKYEFLSTGKKAANVTIGDLKAFYDKGTLSDITLTETFSGSFGSKDMVLKVKLEDTDWEFIKSSKVEIEGTYGFDFKYNSKDNPTQVKFEIDEEDRSVAYIWIAKQTGSNSFGHIKISGLEVDSDEKDLTEGDLLADITTVETVDADDTVGGVALVGGAELDKDYKDIAVAKIANYGAYIKMKDEKAVDIVAGRDEEVVFEVIESVDDVFVGSRTITLDLKDNEEKTDKQFFMIKKDQVDADGLGIIKNGVAKGIIDSDSREIVEKVEFVWEKDTFKKEQEWATGISSDYYRAQQIKVTLKDQDKDDLDLNANKEIDKFKVKTMVYVPVNQQDKKTVEITGEVRGVDEFKSATAVNVIDPFNVEFDQTTLKVGLQDQAAGKIVVTETNKEMFMKGDLYMNITKGSKDNDGIVIEDKGDLTVTGDLKRTDFGDADSNQAEKVTLKRQSKAASTLTIENMEVTVDRTVPEGYYDIELRGKAVDEYDGKYTVEDYIVIGTPNTQDITSAGLAKGTSTFVIGESKYVMNNIEYTMDAPSYLQDPGYTMVPVRYVAQAFGVDSKDILFGNGTVTIFAGERTVSLTNGSNVAVVNGNQVAMGTSVVIKDGRTYAPAGEIARLLGIQTAWDSATKTATFTN